MRMLGPTAPLGSNGCTQSPAMACYPAYMFGTYVKVDAGLFVPPGICIPACADNDLCTAMRGTYMTCSTITGICGG